MIWYHLYNLKNMKQTHGRMLSLIKLQAKTTKSNTLPYLFFMFLNCKNGIKSRKVSQPYINLNNLLLLHSYILNIYLCTRAA